MGTGNCKDWSWLTYFIFGNLADERMTDLGQLVISTRHTGNRGPPWQHLKRSSLPAALGQMMVKKQTQDLVLRVGGRAVFLLWVYAVSAALNWNSISLNSFLGSGLATGRRRHFEGDLKAELKQQPHFFYIIGRLVLDSHTLLPLCWVLLLTWSFSRVCSSPRSCCIPCQLPRILGHCVELFCSYLHHQSWRHVGSKRQTWVLIWFYGFQLAFGVPVYPSFFPLCIDFSFPAARPAVFKLSSRCRSKSLTQTV